MIDLKERIWFRACAALTACLTLWWGTEAWAIGASVQQRSPPAERLADVAARLGIDPAAVRGGEEWKRREADAAAARRASALERLRQRTAPPAGQIERAHVARKEIEERHLPELLGGAARAADDLGRWSRAPTGSASPPSQAAAIEALLRAARERGATRDPRIAEAVGKAERLAKLARSVEGKPVSRGARASIEREAPPSRGGPSLEQRRPALEEPAAPPEPRLAPRLGNVLSTEQRTFYAEVLDAPGLEVESAFGLLDPVDLVNGFAPAPTVATTDLAGLVSAMGAGALGDPTAGDLAHGIDTRLTPEMQAEVARLGNDPLATYNFVHDGFTPEPYYGSKKGSVGAFEERAGNDADLSSLLVALLRAAGVPARYEYGTVEISPEQAMAWAGTTDPRVAADVLVSSGIPAIKMMVGTRVDAVRVEHVWVRALVPYSNYRGLDRPGSRKAWVRLDPTLKRARLREALDLRSAVTFDYPGFLSRIDGTTPLEAYEAQLRAHVKANNLACRTLDDAIPAAETVGDGLTLLPAELPAKIVGSLATFSAFPASMRHRATVSVGTWSVPLDLPAVYGSALTVRYRGATASDAAAMIHGETILIDGGVNARLY